MHTRRQMLNRSGFGLGSIALGSILSDLGMTAHGQELDGNPLAPKPAHFPAKAKRVIHLFQNGGPSQIDSFDPKPALQKWDGKKLDIASLSRLDQARTKGVGFPSPFSFKQYGESGLPVSELFPKTAQHIDDLCVIRSLQSDIPNHEPGLLMMNTGSVQVPKPSVGSWLLYGLGSENQSLPGFVVLCPKGLPTAQSANWRNAFLPGIYQGTYVDSQHTDPEELIANIQNRHLFHKQQRKQLSFVQKLNRAHAEAHPGSPQLEARIESLELAFRMQTEALDAFDIRKEPEKIQEMYGKNQQGQQYLLARRLVEKGVRYVQVYHGEGQPWDSHAKLEENHRRLAGESDQAIAALLTDLKERDMLKDTLVIWGGEMGRTPTVQLPVNKNIGRDHHTNGFTVWMAGGGVKGGMSYGETDEVGLSIAADPVPIHDFHATILHLMGFNHEALTYRYAGRDFRLTDVHGNVVKDILA
ncbi:MAG: DUF1501 domain-containing protein [Verrucomicrobiales bacterium]|nr:DUF1501 domain-containing protein [Verrucomicrobiales bacterium]